MNATRNAIVLLAVTMLTTTALGQDRGQPADRPTVYVPYRDLAELIEPAGGAVLLDRGEFEKLLAAARPDAAPPGQADAAQFSSADLLAVVTASRVVVTGQFTITSLAEGPTQVPLAFGGLGLTRITLDDKPAPLGRGSDGKIVLVVSGRGQHKLAIEAVGHVDDLATGGTKFSFGAPAAVAGRLRVRAPGDLEFRSTAPVVASKYDKQADHSDAELVIGGASHVTVAMLGNGRQADARAILLGESASRLLISPAGHELRCVYTVQVLGRQVRDLRFSLPAGWIVSDVACDNLARWSIEPDGDRQILAVRLSAAAQGMQMLHIAAATPGGPGQTVGTSDSVSRLVAPAVKLLDSDFQRGYLAVIASGQLRVRGRQLRDARQVAGAGAAPDAGRPASPAAPAAIGVGGGEWFQHWGHDWSIGLELAAARLGRSSDDRQIILIDDEQLLLTGQFGISAVGAPMFDVAFDLPADFELVEVTVDGKRDGFGYVLTDAGKAESSSAAGRLRIELPAPVRAEGQMRVGLVMRAKAGAGRAALQPANSDAQETRHVDVQLIVPQVDSCAGVVGIVAGSGIKLLSEPTVVSPPGQGQARLTPVSVGRMATLGLANNVPYAFSYTTAPTDRIALRAGRPEGRVLAESIGLVNLRAAGVAGNWIVNYTISGRPSDRVHLLVDRTLGEAIGIDSPDRRIISRRRIESPPASQPDGQSPQYDLWELSLDAPAIGLVQIHAHYVRAMPAGPFDVPLIRPAWHGGEQVGELVALSADEELAVETAAASASDTDALLLPDHLPLPGGPDTKRRLLAVWRLEPMSSGGHARISVTCSAHQRHAIPVAIVDVAQLVTHLGPPPAGRQMTEATYRIVNAGLQFVRIRLPDNGTLWSLRVDEKTARPGRDGQGHYLVAVPQAGEPIELRVLYVLDGSPAKLAAPSLPDVQVNRVSWRVVPPPGYEILPGRASLTPLNQPRPAPAILDIADAFVGTSAQPAFQDREYVLAVPSVSWQEEPRGPAASQPESGYRPERKGKSRAISAGLYTLPVDLPSEAGAGPAVEFVGLAGEQLAVELAPQSAKRAWWGLGLSVGVLLGVFGWRASAGRKFALVLMLLVGATLSAFIWPGAVWPANGVFYGAALMAGLYVLRGLARALLGAHSARLRSALAGLLLVMILTAPTAAQQPQPQASASAPPAALPPPKMPIVVPYDSDPAGLLGVGKTGRDQVLVPLGYYRELRDRASGRPADGRIELTISDAHYVASLDTSSSPARFRVTLRAHVATGSQPAIGQQHGNATAGGGALLALPLAMRNLAVVSATLDGAPVRIQTIGANEPEQPAQQAPHARPAVHLAVLLEAGAAGLLEVNAMTTPRPAGGGEDLALADWQRGSVAVGLPDLPGATLRLTLPHAPDETQTNLQVDGMEESIISRADGQWVIPLGLLPGGAGGPVDVTMRWSPRRLAGGQTDRSLSASVQHDVFALQWAMVGVSRFAFTFTGGEHDSLSVLVPEGATVVGVAGPQVRDSQDDGPAEIDGRKFRVFRVRLVGNRSPGADKIEFTMRWLDDLVASPAHSGDTALAALPLPQAGGVARESGSVTLYAAAGLDVEVTGLHGGRRAEFAAARPPAPGGADTGGAPTAIGDASRSVGQFVWPYRPFAISVRIIREPATGLPGHARLSQLVRVMSDHTQVQTQAQLCAPNGKLFASIFELPDDYDVLTVTGAAVADWYVQPPLPAQRRRLHVALNGGSEAVLAIVCSRLTDIGAASAGQQLTVPMLRAIDSAGRPLPHPPGGAAATSRLAVQTPAALSAETISADGLRPLAPTALGDWLDAAQVQAVRFAYAQDAPEASLRLNIRRRPSRISVDLLGGLAIHPAAAWYSYRLRYSVEGYPVDEICFELDEQFSRVATVSSPAIRGVRTSPGQDGRVRWTIALIQELTGTLDLAINFAVPLDPARQTTLPIPRIATTAPDGYRAVLAVQNLSRHQVETVGREKLSDIPAAQQVGLLGQRVAATLHCAVECFADDWQLAVQVTPVQPAQRARAIIDLMAITTVLDSDGQARYQVELLIQNRSEQFLAIELPEGFRLWSAMVAGVPVRPAAGASDRQPLIPLHKTSAVALPYVVRLYLAGRACEPLARVSRLTLPAIRIGNNIQIRRTTWSLRLPRGYHYLARGGNMSELADRAEAVSMLIDAQLDQLTRLQEAMEDPNVTYQQRDELEFNWRQLNKDISGNVKRLDDDISSSTFKLGNETASRISGKLRDQSQSQYAAIGKWEEAKRKEADRLSLTINNSINAAADNAGISELSRNNAMLAMPSFVDIATEQQIAQLATELEKATQSVDQIRRPQAGQRPADVQVDAGALLAYGERARLRGPYDYDESKLARQRQTEVHEQMLSLKDNRAQRFYEKINPNMPGTEPLTKAGAGTLIISGTANEFAQAGEGMLILDGSNSFTGGGVNINTANGRLLAQAAPSSEMPAPMDSRLGWSGGEPAVAAGTFSLPVQLPEGGLQMEFARPGGDAELTIVAFEQETVSSVLGLLGLLAGLAAVWIVLALARRLARRRTAGRIVSAG